LRHWLADNRNAAEVADSPAASPEADNPVAFLPAFRAAYLVADSPAFPEALPKSLSQKPPVQLPQVREWVPVPVLVQTDC